MKHTKKAILTMVLDDGFSCSICKTRYEQDDYVENQEALHFVNHCGDGSVFGDMSKISLDICQHCIKSVLGQYIEQTNEYCCNE